MKSTRNLISAIVSLTIGIMCMAGDVWKLDNVKSEVPDFYGPYTPGEKVSEMIPELVGYTVKGLPSGLKFDKKTGVISGAAKKPTGDAGVTVTFTKKGTETITATFVVAPIPTINVTLAGDTEKCKVSGGNKAYLVGKKVSLTAKGPKGTVFVGWTENGEPWPNEDEWEKDKIKYLMTTESLDLVATFEKEQLSIICPDFEGCTLTVGQSLNDGIALTLSTQSGVKSVKATKLPTGLKLLQDKATKEWRITGTPKKVGIYNTTLILTAKSGATQTFTSVVTVVEKNAGVIEVPDTIAGEYWGFIGAYNQKRPDDDEWVGTVWVRVDEGGNLDAVVTTPKGESRFSATGFDSIGEASYWASGPWYVAKAYKVTMKNTAGDELQLAFDSSAKWTSSTPFSGIFKMKGGSEFWVDGEMRITSWIDNRDAANLLSNYVGIYNLKVDKSIDDVKWVTSASNCKLTVAANGKATLMGVVDGHTLNETTWLTAEESSDDDGIWCDFTIPINATQVLYFEFKFDGKSINDDLGWCEYRNFK